MYKNILIATDGSELSAKALEQGLTLAKALNAKATAVTVTTPVSAYAVGDAMIVLDAEQIEEQSAKAAKTNLDAASKIAKRIGVPCETVRTVSQWPYEEIIATAEAKGCDLIVMASHGRRGIAALVLGSETTKLLTHSKIPVLVCR